MAAARRELFAGPGAATAVSDAWPMRHLVLASVLWPALITGVFRSWAVHRSRSPAA
ncbi:hypothetical protein [Streptomyces sp. TP-A0874]|uniref:hypothetical protein n=1 Tax=Streptomyces sp. TP-A0874 TaxID=549819 RepID=UPI00147FB4D8|nr:hypothetical protein [Streptomyces sp. TP-A0874]